MRLAAALLITLVFIVIPKDTWGDTEGSQSVPAADSAQTPAQSIRVVEIWARATFSNTGQLHRLELADQADQPEAFLAQVHRQLAQARIKPPEQDGRGLEFQTGVRVRYEISSSGGSSHFRLLDLAIRPIPYQRTATALPLIRLDREGEWRGSIKGTCTVDTRGRCSNLTLDALPGTPEGFIRWVRQSMLSWRFEPQMVDGQPVTGEFDHTFYLGVNMRQLSPENFRIPKFDRILMQRQ